MTRSVRMTARTESDATPARRRVSRPAAQPAASPEKPATRRKVAARGNTRKPGNDWTTRAVSSSSGGSFYKTAANVTDIIAFLEPSPFLELYKHWANSHPRNCIGEDCPLCEIGNDPSPAWLFNVVNLKGDPDKVLYWEAGREIFSNIARCADELTAMGKTIDHPDIYFSVSRHQKVPGKGPWVYSINRVKSRDLVEDYSVEPLTPEAREALAENCKTEEDIIFNTVDELRAFVDELPE